MKEMLTVIVALLIVSTMFVSCTPGPDNSPSVSSDNQTEKLQSPAAVDNKTISMGQSAAVASDSRRVDAVQPVNDPGQMLPRILFLRIDSSSNNPNLYGKYDLTSVSRDIWVMDIDGGHAANLTRGSANAMSADWSPDKSKIIFDSVSSYLQGSPVCSISVMDADGSNIKVVSPGATSRHFPAWSPDGNKIANSKYSVASCGKTLPCKYFTLFTFNQDGSADTQVKFSPSTGYQVLPRWFPDSKRIAFLDYQMGYYEIWSGDISKDGDLTKYDIISNPNYLPWFSLSPDATEIAYSHDYSRDNYHAGREIFVFNITKGEMRRLTRNDYADDNPCFSPDGKQILFASFGDTEETRGIFIMDIDGRNLKQISSQYGDMPMKWK